jgi:hypothetical protein
MARDVDRSARPPGVPGPSSLVEIGDYGLGTRDRSAGVDSRKRIRRFF